METPTEINERIIGKITDEEKDYMILTQRQTIGVIGQRVLNATRFINTYITKIKKEHPDKWVTITLLQTILDYLGKNRVMITINGTQHEVFETNTSFRQICELAYGKFEVGRECTYGPGLHLFPDEEVFVTEGLEFKI